MINIHHWLHLIHHHMLRSAAAALTLLFLITIIILAVQQRRPRKLDPDYFMERWKELQKQCASKTTWPLAVIDADKLLDEVLKKRRYKGKTMGERLVSAQRDLTSNDTVWFGHKLRNKLVHEEYKLTRKTEVKRALLGYLQALKDLGALKRDK